jgi:toxin ParE1/3/4
MIVWAPEAASDLEAAVLYLAERNPTAARKLAERILALIERLESEPIEGPEHELTSGEIVRGWPYPPFRIYYRRTAEALQILRIYHQRQAPIVR